MNPSSEVSSWSSDCLSEALLGLTGLTRLQNDVGHRLPSPPPNVEVERWLQSAADCLGFQVRAVECAFSELGDVLRRIGPAFVGIEHPTGVRYLAVVGATRGTLRILTPAGEVQNVQIDVVRQWIGGTASGKDSALIDVCMAAARVQRHREPLQRQALVDVLSPTTRAHRLWMLEADYGSPFVGQLRSNGVLSLMSWTLALSVMQVAALAYSWVLIGEAALNGVVQRSLMWAWLLLVATAGLMGVGVLYLGNRCLADINRLLKARLFRGALRLTTDKVRTRGSGKILAMVSESEVLSSAGLAGTFGMAVAIVHLLSAIIICFVGAGGWLQCGLLLGWTVAMGWLVRRYLRVRVEWSQQRFTLSQVALENVLGHRTRVVQQPSGVWHEHEDHLLASYSTKSEEMDRLGRMLSVAPGRGWLILGLVALMPTLIMGGTDAAALGLAFGGMLQAHAALTALASQVVPVSSAIVAWGQVQELFQAAAHLSTAGNPSLSISLDTEQGPDVRKGVDFLTMRKVSFRHETTHRPVLTDCSLSVRTGERILLQGPSGGGKSTLGSLMSGIRAPQSGQILLWGFDRRSIGDAAWRRRVVLVPQFHENHIVTASLAFNLLMGTQWPPSAEALREARQVCVELGLEPLVLRMPQRLHQVVGDSGWQLSHGERARVFLARALLQRSEVLILDESFAALDATTLQLCMDSVRRRARTLVAIAHP